LRRPKKGLNGFKRLFSGKCNKRVIFAAWIYTQMLLWRWSRENIFINYMQRAPIHKPRSLVSLGQPEKPLENGFLVLMQRIKVAHQRILIAPFRRTIERRW
jgi:hypothetical protein